jgi:hypothetical protein
MEGELNMCPFERRVVGRGGAILLRRNEAHARECRTAIRRRRHPGWSSFNCTFHVEAPSKPTKSPPDFGPGRWA